MFLTGHRWYRFLPALCVAAEALHAQSSPPGNAATALDSPALQPNAYITQHNPPGSPIDDTLEAARAGAPARGIVWRGIEIHHSDHAGGMAVPDSALLEIHKKRVCSADAVVIGHTILEKAHLSAYRTAVYTDYLFVVDSVLKDNVRSPIRAQAQLVVTRVGGSIVLPNGPVKYEPEEFAGLQTTDVYLQFLRFIPETGSYHAIDGFSSFSLKGNRWAMTRRSAAARVLPEFNRGSFEKVITAWAASPCK